MNYRKVILTAMMMAIAVMVNAQSLAVYISDNSGSATNVRNAPKGKVVAKLNANSGIMFDVESPRNGWWKISGGVYTDPDKDMDDFRLKGSTTGYWVHYSVIGFSTSNYGGQTLHLRQSPSVWLRRGKIRDGAAARATVRQAPHHRFQNSARLPPVCGAAPAAGQAAGYHPKGTAPPDRS